MVSHPSFDRKMQMAYTYSYPRPMATVDMLLLRYNVTDVELLLVQRKHEPFEGMWALPGGFIEMNETLRESAQRELSEETSLKDVPLFSLLFSGDPGRDPRGRTITSLFGAVLSPPFPQVLPGDDAGKAEWFSLKKLPELAFDHRDVIEKAVEELKCNSLWRLWIYLFLPLTFNQRELKNLCTIFLNKADYVPLLLEPALQLGWLAREDDDNFRKMISSDELINTAFSKVSEIWLHLMNKKSSNKL